jgi:hypothetical protein
MTLDTYEVIPVPAQSDDALAAFRLQARQELEGKSEKGKLSESALAKLRTIREQDKTQAVVDGRFATALKSVIVNDANLRKLIGRCNVSVPAKQIERRALKLAWWIAAGFLLGREIESVSLVNFFSELVGDELTMSDSRFASVWNVAAAPKLRASRLGRGLIGSDEPVYRPCKADKKCLRYEKRKPAPAKGSGEYCSPACAASDRSRAKRALAALPSAPTIQ